MLGYMLMKGLNPDIQKQYAVCYLVEIYAEDDTVYISHARVQ